MFHLTIKKQKKSKSSFTKSSLTCKIIGGVIRLIFIFMKQTIKIFKALSDPTRLRILMLLLQGDLCVCELVFILKMEQSRISHQLRVLKDADLVEYIRDSKWTIYKIPKKFKKNLKAVFDKFLREDLSDSEEFKRDEKNLEICIKSNVRIKKCGRNWLFI